VTTDFRQGRAFGAALILLTAVLTVAIIPSSAQRTGAAAPEPAKSREFLNQFCVGCHNQRLKTANLMLDKLDLANVAHDAETWEKVVGKLRAGMMPPAAAKHPEKAALQGFVEDLEARLDAASPDQSDPGATALHRLNRIEYANAVRTLTGIDVDPTTLLPPDDSSEGFDNIADVLGVSPALLERYLAAAAKVSRMAIGSPSIAPSTEK